MSETQTEIKSTWPREENGRSYRGPFDLIGVPVSVLVKHQKREYRKDVFEGGDPVTVIMTVRHDDDCGNGHNSFAVTAEVYEAGYQRGEPTVKHSAGKKLYLHACGCCHDEVRRHFPELAHLIKWHLMSTDEPMHYVANARYWAGFAGWVDGKPGSPPNEAHLKSTIVFGAAPQWDDGRKPMEFADDGLVMWLGDRLPDLLEAFKRDVEAIGFTY